LKFSGLRNRDLRSMSPAAKALAKEAATARRVLPLRSAALLLGTLVFLIVYAVSSILGRNSESSSTMLSLASVGGVWIVASWVQHLREKRDSAQREALPRRLVIWLRRFHQGGDGKFPMTLLFSELSEWGVLACTLSDSTIGRSDDAEAIMHRVAARDVTAAHAAAKTEADRRARFPSFALLTVGIPLSGLAALFTERAFPNYAWAALAAGLILTLAATWLVRRAIFRRLYDSKAVEQQIQMTTDKALADSLLVSAERAQTYFHRLQAELNVQANELEQGFLVLRVKDPDWQAVVASALETAHAVLIDVSHLSPNVEWELQQLAQHQGKIVFALGVESPADISSALSAHPSCQRLDALLGAGWHERNQLFIYPEHVPQRQRMSEAERQMPLFTKAIYEAMAR
jgi:hypothetical protein